jgi:hypothetical protein
VTATKPVTRTATKRATATPTRSATPFPTHTKSPIQTGSELFVSTPDFNFTPDLIGTESSHRSVGFTFSRALAGSEIRRRSRRPLLLSLFLPFVSIVR